MCAVYPRVCGGTGLWRTEIDSRVGLSPRVRGNLDELNLRRRYRRSIPACAGEPRRLDILYESPRVYPRVCGGTGLAPRGVNPDAGLSPRVRGNLQGSPRVLAGQGSIPACAGEPSVPTDLNAFSTVYPRVCGGTDVADSDSAPTDGLSPRVRGNPPRIP